nr:MAG TPA: hypothetical protein [Caudoviricetes sp.]
MERKKWLKERNNTYPRETRFHLIRIGWIKSDKC